MERFKIIVVVGFLLLNTIWDLKYKKIPYIPCGIVTGIGILCLLFMKPINWWQFLGVLVGCGLILVSLVTKQSIGMGDGMILASIGVFIGFWKSLMVLFIAGIMVSVVGGILLALKKVSLKTPLPFVPFLFVAYGVSLIL
jgi:leader peptidase (prepilin peptidase)/N-methyltransferase